MNLPNRANLDNLTGVENTLAINEIYLSLQGESTLAGLPCIFVRLTACNLRCSYCDTAYAFTEGKKRTLAEIRADVKRLAAPFVAADVRRRTRTPTTHEPPREGTRPTTCRPAPTRRFLLSMREQKTVEATQNPLPYVGGYVLPLIELTGGEPLLQANS